MEGSANKPEGKKSTTKFLVIGIVAILILVGVAAVVLSSNGGDDDKEADNYFDKGFKLELFYNNGNSARETACQIMKQNLEALNPGKIQITVTGVEWAQYLELRKTGAMPAFFLGWAPDYADPDDYVQPFYLSGGTYCRMIGYANDTLDQKIGEAAGELDPEVRADLYYELSMDMFDECLFIWTAQATNFHVERDWLSGYYFNPMYSGLYYYAYSKNASAPEPDTFRQGNIAGNPEYLDPAIDYETAGGEILQNVYETLVFYDREKADVFVPQLASEVPTVENGGISADGLTYIFNLRSGVKFHDGTDMTAEDVKYSLERALKLNDPHGPVWMQGQVLIPDYYSLDAGVFEDDGTLTSPITDAMIDDCMWVVDADTIQFNLTMAYPAFLSTLAFNGASVVSEDFVEANGGMTKAGYDYMNEDLCGTGPYEFVSFTPGSDIVLKAFPGYWQTPASIENVIIKQVADDTSRVLQLKAGDLDSAQVPRAKMFDVMDQAGTPVDGLAITRGLGTFNIDFLGLNQNINLTAADPLYTDVPSDFFADKNVRLAFAHAFDDELYIESALLGTAIQPNGAIPQGMFGYNASVPVYAHDADLAKEYLKAAKLPETPEASSVDIAQVLVARLEN